MLQTRKMKTMDNITELLDRLGFEKNGRWENGFYVIPIPDSDTFALYETRLSMRANDSENPSQESNTNRSLVKWTDYYTIDVNNITYNLFLIADFENNEYLLKIKEAETE